MNWRYNVPSKTENMHARPWHMLALLVILGLSGTVSGQDRGKAPKHVIAALTTVQVLLDENGETYLAGPEGMTLYTLKKDKPSAASKCIGGCAENWPPLVAEQQLVAPPGLAGKLGTLKRRGPDCRIQVTYQDQQLYYWFRDQAPGDITGDGIGDIWSVARPVNAKR